MFTKQTIKDIDLRGKRVLMRADYNVPVSGGKITDDYRIVQSLPTIKYILEQGAALVLLSHLGRPKSKDDKDCSLAPVAQRLSDLLGKDVRFASDCVGEPAGQACWELPAGHIVLLENVRFHPEEEKNDEAFAKHIVENTGAEVFVQDGFGVVHRAHATTDAIAKLLPAVAGFLLEKEVDTITKVMHDPVRPLVAVIGGAKIHDKIDILNRLIDMADCVAIGGAMANDFLVAEGLNVSDSMVDQESVDKAKTILERARAEEKKRAFNFLVPVDVVVSEKIDGSTPTRIVDLQSHTIADIEAYPKVPTTASHTVATHESIFDIGPVSAAMIAGTIRLAKTVVWNGTCGVTETKGLAGAADPFAHGTKTVVEAMIGGSQQHNNKPFTLVGGGDTVGYVEAQNMVADFGHVSTGGGASLELMSGRKLPGVEVLLNKVG
jgi:phosphoglycerate kinase